VFADQLDGTGKTIGLDSELPTQKLARKRRDTQSLPSLSQPIAQSHSVENLREKPSVYLTCIKEKSLYLQPETRFRQQVKKVTSQYQTEIVHASHMLGRKVPIVVN
jgi:hypothetical protein